MGMKTVGLVGVLALGATAWIVASSDAGGDAMDAFAAMHAPGTATAAGSVQSADAAASEGSGATPALTDRTSVPLSVDGSGRLVVPVVTADGRTLRFAVSTAVPTSMVARSIGGEDAAALGLRLEGVDQPLPDVQSADDAAFVFEGHAVDGFVGLSTLGDVDVLLDAPGGRMVLQPIARAVEWSDVALGPPTRLQVFHGVALRMEVEVDGHPFGATVDLARPRNVMNPAAAGTTGVQDGGTGTVDFEGRTRTLLFDVADTSILDRWDPDGVGFLSFGAAIAADCAVSISWFHQELRMCVS